MEDIERVTPDQIETLRKKFAQKVSSANAAFCAEDLEKIKNDDLWIRRFIAAQENDVDNATTMLFETCQWRKEFGVNELDHTKLLPTLVSKGALFIRNKDNWGKHLLIFKAKNHVKGVNDMEEVKKYIVYWFERIERLAKSDQISVIFDMKDTGWNNMDMDFIRYLITLLKQYYPHLVNYLMIFEMPWLLKSAWNIIKAWLPPKFVDRVKFVDKKTLKEFINEKNALAEWGGMDNYTDSFQPEVRVKVQKSSVNTFSAKDEKLQKVKFIDHDGTADIHDIDVQNVAPPPPVPVPRTDARLVRREVPTPLDEGSTSERTSSPHTQNAAPQLFESNDVLVFEFDGAEYNANIRIHNITRENIIFKIKTTAPNSYRVKPTIGILAPGVEALSNIVTNGPINVREHRFQIQSAILPRDLDPYSSGEEDAHLDHAVINSLWKRTIEQRGVSMYSKRLTISVQNNNNSRQGHSMSLGTGNSVTMNEDDMRRGLAELEKKITDNVKGMIEANTKKTLTILYILASLVLFFGILHFFILPSVCVSSKSDCPCALPLPSESIVEQPESVLGGNSVTPLSPPPDTYKYSSCVAS